MRSSLLRIPILSFLVLAAIVALATLGPSQISQPQAASAQTNVYCGPAGFQPVTCPNSTAPLYCNGTSVDANGNQFCSSVAYTSCPNGVTVTFGTPCPNSGTAYGTAPGFGVGVCGTTLVFGPCTPTAGAVTATSGGNIRCPDGSHVSNPASCPGANTPPPMVASSAPPTYTCPNGGPTVTDQSQCPATTSSGSTSTASGNSSSSGSVPGPSNGVPVTFVAGWNLVGAPDGTVLNGAGGSLSTYQPGDSNYESMPSSSPVKGGKGYWAYFNSSATQNLAKTTSGTVSMTLPAGTPVLIGNPGSGMATVSGATTVSTYDPTSGQYVSTTTLKPGQGAWAEVDAGGTVTITTSG
jgi:hypothetical protein